MLRAAVVMLLTLLAGSVAAADAPAQRVVSLDYCADQFVLKMLPRERLLAVSPDATKVFSYMRDAARGLPTVRPVAEDVLMQEPDLVVRSYGGGPNAARFFELAGVPVLQVPYASDIDGIREVIASMASGLGVPERGAAIIADMERRLGSLPTPEAARKALYMTPTGATSGPGTQVHDMLLAAGLENFEQQPGWRFISLERLAYEEPDMIVAAFFDDPASDIRMWSPMRHPLARRQMLNRPTVKLQGAWTSCGGWFLVDAIEALAAP